MENQNNDDSSHYEISLTAGQAFIAFVLLLFSLAAAFAFGVIVGKGQFDDNVAAATVPQERPRVQEARVADLGSSPSKSRPLVEMPTPVIIEEDPFPTDTAAVETAPVPRIERPASTAPVPHFAQLLSTADAQAAEQLAAKLIEGGFTSAYVERTTSPRGMVHRVRVKFPSETEARSAVARLRSFAAGEIWIAKQ
jgi:cell division septation protein DedD